MFEKIAKILGERSKYLGMILSASFFILAGLYIYLQDGKENRIQENTSVIVETVAIQSQEEQVTKGDFRGEEEAENVVNAESTLSLVTKFPVHIMGAVQRPGVYLIEEGYYLEKLIQLAGGLRSDADQTKINLASLVEAHDKIVIPTVHEKEFVPNVEGEDLTQAAGVRQNVIHSGDTKSDHQDKKAFVKSKISINRATAAELQSVPGIGEQMAKKIVSYRRQHGAFQHLEDLMRVPGIKQAKFKKISPFLKL